MVPDKLGMHDSHLQGEKATGRAKARINKRSCTCCFAFWILTLLSCLILVAINPSALFAHHSYSIGHLSELACLYPFIFHLTVSPMTQYLSLLRSKHRRSQTRSSSTNTVWFYVVRGFSFSKGPYMHDYPCWLLTWKFWRVPHLPFAGPVAMARHFTES